MRETKTCIATVAFGQQTRESLEHTDYSHYLGKTAAAWSYEASESESPPCIATLAVSTKTRPSAYSHSSGKKDVGSRFFLPYILGLASHDMRRKVHDIGLMGRAIHGKCGPGEFIAR